MNEERINELLQRYFNGAASLEEERWLQQQFSKKDHLPQSQEALRPLFTFFAEERTIQPPAPKRTIPLTWLWAAAGIAAGIALTITIITQQPAHYIYYADGQRIYNRQEAIARAENSLQQLAISMQKAQNGMVSIEKIQHGSRQLQQLGKMQQAYRQINFETNH